MITYINKNIFEDFNNRTINCIAHVCNMKGNMGAGIAKVIANKYPNVKKEDEEVFNTYFKNKNGQKPLFNVSVEYSNNSIGSIINIYAMENPGRSFSKSLNDTMKHRLSRFSKAIKKIKEKMSKEDKIGFPLVLSGLGRDSIIDKDLSDLEYFKKHIAPLITFDANVYYL